MHLVEIRILFFIMEDSAQISICLEDSLDAALLPKLKSDLDSVPIEKEHFAEYENALKTQLPVIFDLLQLHKSIINGNTKLQSKLILLCCELTALDSIFRIDDERLIRNATSLLQEYRDYPKEVDEFIFKYYQTRLTNNEWKRNMGAVHGIEQFLQVFYKNEKLLNVNWLSFCLSVALNVRDCHDSSYKHLGIRIFHILLKRAKPDDMRNLNIYCVIYDSVLKDVHLMENVRATKDTWNCLYLCLDYLENIDSLNWCQVDDLLEILIRNVPLASNNPVSICMLNFLPKFFAYFTLNHEEIMSQSYSIFEENNAVNDGCESCASNTGYSCFRWAKTLLDLIVFESYKLMQSIETCLELLRAMIRCYMVCIIPIPLPVIEPHLMQFYEKFTSVLMEVLVTHEKQNDAVKLVKIFLEIMLWQLKYSSYVGQNLRLITFREAFTKLLAHTVLS